MLPGASRANASLYAKGWCGDRGVGASRRRGRGECPPPTGRAANPGFFAGVARQDCPSSDVLEPDGTRASSSNSLSLKMRPSSVKSMIWSSYSKTRLTWATCGPSAAVPWFLSYIVAPTAFIRFFTTERNWSGRRKIVLQQRLPCARDPVRHHRDTKHKRGQGVRMNGIPGISPERHGKIVDKDLAIHAKRLNKPNRSRRTMPMAARPTAPTRSATMTPEIEIHCVDSALQEETQRDGHGATPRDGALCGVDAVAALPRARIMNGAVRPSANDRTS